MTKQKIEQKLETLDKQYKHVIVCLENPDESMFTEETLLRLKKSIWYEVTQLKLKLKAKDHE